jgi:hypothetical protein
MPSQKLKPCKCGGEPFFSVERISSFGTITAWSVRCRNKSCPRYLYAHGWPTREAAVNDWNRHAETEGKDRPRPGLLTRIRALLRRAGEGTR